MKLSLKILLDMHDSLIMIFVLISQIAVILYLVKHKSIQSKFSVWSGGYMPRQTSFYNLRIFYGFALLLFVMLLGELTRGMLIRSGVHPDSGAITTAYLIVTVLGILLFWVLAVRYRKRAMSFDSQVGIEIVYGVLTAFALTFASWLWPLAFILGVVVFWISYGTISRKFNKWSGGEFVAPQKRYSWLMLHGLGLVVFVPVAAIIAFFIGAAITSLFIPKGSLDNNSTTFTVFSFVLVLCAIVSAVYAYWLIIYNKRKQSGATKNQVRWEIIYGAIAMYAWIGAVILGIYAIIALVVLVALYIIIRIFSFFCFSEEITVKRGGLFGGSKKVYAERNLDGSYTDLAGNHYKKSNNSGNLLG